MRGHPGDLDTLSSTDVRHLVHELQVHQIELELQNEELRRTQLELEAARDRYFDLYDLAPAGYFTLNRDGLILDANLTGSVLLGVDRRDLINKPFSLFVASGDQQAFLSHRQQALKSGAIQSGELRMLTGDGTLFHARLESIAIPESQNPEATLCRTIVSNVTERVQAEEAVRQLTQDLQARNEDLDAFAHTLAHSFSNSVSRIVLGASFLEHELRQLSWQMIKEQLHRIAETGYRMDKEVDALLLLAGASGQEPVTIEPLEMGSIVADALESLSHMIEEYRAEIVLLESWPTVLGFQPWVEAVWVNYISNGIKYGGRPPLLELGATAERDTVRFWVRDNGAGLSADDQARLFTPFERIGRTDVHGTGLGLSIVRRIVERMGGQVGVENAGTAGSGCVFYFTLPVDQT